MRQLARARVGTCDSWLVRGLARATARGVVTSEQLTSDCDLRDVWPLVGLISGQSTLD